MFARFNIIIFLFTWSLLVIFPSFIRSHPEYTAKITSPSRQHRVTMKIRPGTFIHTALMKNKEMLNKTYLIYWVTIGINSCYHRLRFQIQDGGYCHLFLFERLRSAGLLHVIEEVWFLAQHSTDYCLYPCSICSERIFFLEINCAKPFQTTQTFESFCRRWRSEEIWIFPTMFARFLKVF